MRRPYRYPFPEALLGQYENITVTGTITTNLFVATGASSIAALTMSGNLTLTSGGTIGSSANGDIRLLPSGTGITKVGDSYSSQHISAVNDNFFVSGQLECKGSSFLTGAVRMYTSCQLNSLVELSFGGSNESRLYWNTSQSTSPSLFFALGNSSKTLILSIVNNRSINHLHGDQANPILFVHSARAPNSYPNEWIGISHNASNARYTRGTGIHQFDAAIRFSGSLYYDNQHTEVFSLDPAAAGATFVAPDANTLGGFQLDADTEFLYFSGYVRSNWDAATDLEVLCTFEVNVNNGAGGGGDTVDLSLSCWYKGDAETANKTQVIEVAEVVGQSAQYKQFTTTFTINHDLVDHVVQVGDKLSFRLHLETDTSEVDDIIINTCYPRYKTGKIGYEV